MIVALPGLFSYLFFLKLKPYGADNVDSDAEGKKGDIKLV